VLDGTFQVRTLTVIKDKHPDLYASARKMKVGQLSDVIKTPDSLHIIKLKEYEPERQYTLDEARGVIEGKFRVRAQDNRIREWEEELKRTATIEITEEATAAAAPGP
jgi:parvulin-like peptidyl-prolyl isomerase